MSNPVISVELLSKSYLIGHDAPQESYYSLRETIVRHGKNCARKIVDMARGRQVIQGDSIEEFWALRDVSFEVRQGDVLGIIGRNGAGKSTLLKILSRITEPTSGRVILEGRVASLLEVGTGFHPELSGRENIFLNGAILGMGKREMTRKFDEIVAFAEVEKFLDTPVKRYSSGMYVRLAFAVAAHLEPEILIVDEVLAVGDTQFQKKCLGKMKDFANGGRTVIFVSHNMNAVRNLCDKCCLLESGKVKMIGPSLNVIGDFLSAESLAGSQFQSSDPTDIKIESIYFEVENKADSDVFESGDQVWLHVKTGAHSEKKLIFGFTIYNQANVAILLGVTYDSFEYIPCGVNHLAIKLPTNLFMPGAYRVAGSLTQNGKTTDFSEAYLFFSVIRHDRFDVGGYKTEAAFRLPPTWIPLE
jgi:lipopolysaccharide transport system ATP-binding protein